MSAHDVTGLLIRWKNGSADLSHFSGIAVRLMRQILFARGLSDRLQAGIVDPRFFGGYAIKETAELVGCSPATVSREWPLARIWLYRAMSGESGAA